jgi:nucleotidyltransferase substrate binding protein (TIGR01987 family)
MAQDIRWKQRFQNFDLAYGLLKKAAEADTLSDLEKEGMIQRFEYTFELAWKCLKDFLDHGGNVIDPLTPRQVIKEAFAARILADGHLWIEMLDHRNLLSHTYNPVLLDKAVEAISGQYLKAFEQVHRYLATRRET